MNRADNNDLYVNSSFRVDDVYGEYGNNNETQSGSQDFTENDSEELENTASTNRSISKKAETVDRSPRLLQTNMRDYCRIVQRANAGGIARRPFGELTNLPKFANNCAFAVDSPKSRLQAIAQRLHAGVAKSARRLLPAATAATTTAAAVAASAVQVASRKLEPAPPAAAPTKKKAVGRASNATSTTTKTSRMKGTTTTTTTTRRTSAKAELRRSSQSPNSSVLSISLETSITSTSSSESFIVEDHSATAIADQSDSSATKGATTTAVTVKTKAHHQRYASKIAENSFNHLDESCIPEAARNHFHRAHSSSVLEIGPHSNNSNENSPDRVGSYTLTSVSDPPEGHNRAFAFISAESLAGMIRSMSREEFHRKFILIDCRYPYEFNGGHIQYAINLYDTSLVEAFFYPSDHDNFLDLNSRVPIFYCEYSQKRGPTMAMALRHFDRKRNANRYPAIDYKELYVLHRGYRNFFYSGHVELCTPGRYVEMDCDDFKSLLARYRAHERRIQAPFLCIYGTELRGVYGRRTDLTQRINHIRADNNRRKRSQIERDQTNRKDQRGTKEEKSPKNRENQEDQKDQENQKNQAAEKTLKQKDQEEHEKSLVTYTKNTVEERNMVCKRTTAIYNRIRVSPAYDRIELGMESKRSLSASGSFAGEGDSSRQRKRPKLELIMPKRGGKQLGLRLSKSAPRGGAQTGAIATATTATTATSVEMSTVVEMVEEEEERPEMTQHRRDFVGDGIGDWERIVAAAGRRRSGFREADFEDDAAMDVSDRKTAKDPQNPVVNAGELEDPDTPLTHTDMEQFNVHFNFPKESKSVAGASHLHRSLSESCASDLKSALSHVFPWISESLARDFDDDRPEPMDFWINFQLAADAPKASRARGAWPTPIKLEEPMELETTQITAAPSVDDEQMNQSENPSGPNGARDFRIHAANSHLTSTMPEQDDEDADGSAALRHRLEGIHVYSPDFRPQSTVPIKPL